MKKKNKGLLGRLFGRKTGERPHCPYICRDGLWYRQEWKDGACVPVGEPLSECPVDEDAELAGMAPNAEDAARSEPPPICWKGQLYRQKWVDGGLEAYGEPLGPC